MTTRDEFLRRRELGRRCVVIARTTGRLCRNWPMSGADRCRYHDGPRHPVDRERALRRASKKAAYIYVRKAALAAPLELRRYPLFAAAYALKRWRVAGALALAFCIRDATFWAEVVALAMKSKQIAQALESRRRALTIGQ